MKIVKVWATILGALVGTTLLIFPTAYVLMRGWNIIAWNANLPQFTYWNVFWIAWAVQMFAGLFRKAFTVTSDKD